jgi:hypothetical protein
MRRSIKLLIIFIFLSIANWSIAQNHDHIKPYKINESGGMYLDKIFENPEMTKEDLFNKSKIWMAKEFVDSKQVDRFDDINSGKIVGKANVPFISALTVLDGSASRMLFTLQIYCKDGKARMILDDIIYKSGTNNYTWEAYYFQKGDHTRNPKTGKVEFKRIRTEQLQKVFSSWLEGMNKSDEYSDF